MSVIMHSIYKVGVQFNTPPGTV